MEWTTHQGKSCLEPYKSRRNFIATLRSLLSLEIGDNLLKSYLSLTGGSSQIPKVIVEYILRLTMNFDKIINVIFVLDFG